MNPIVSKIRQAWTWLKTRLGIAAVVGVLALSGQARADDPIQLEMARTQLKLNQLLEQRIANLEKRVALLEQKMPTAYTPGNAPPQVTPSYSPPAGGYSPPATNYFPPAGGYSPYGASGTYTVPPNPLPDCYTRNLK
jgi:hypothetical protein